MRWLWAIIIMGTLTLTGCDFLERAGDTANTRNPDTGMTYGDQVVSGAKQVGMNPMGIGGWVYLLTGIAAIIAGGFGATVGGKALKKNKEMEKSVEELKSKIT